MPSTELVDCNLSNGFDRERQSSLCIPWGLWKNGTNTDLAPISHAIYRVLPGLCRRQSTCNPKRGKRVSLSLEAMMGNLAYILAVTLTLWNFAYGVADTGIFVNKSSADLRRY